MARFRCPAQARRRQWRSGWLPVELAAPSRAGQDIIRSADLCKTVLLLCPGCRVPLQPVDERGRSGHRAIILPHPQFLACDFMRTSRYGAEADGASTMRSGGGRRPSRSRKEWPHNWAREAVAACPPWRPSLPAQPSRTGVLGSHRPGKAATCRGLSAATPLIIHARLQELPAPRAASNARPTNPIPSHIGTNAGILQSPTLPNTHSRPYSRRLHAQRMLAGPLARVRPVFLSR